MSTESQCQLCHLKVETEDHELLCVKRKGPCWGKIVKPLHKCKFFIDCNDLTKTTRKLVEDTSDINNAFTILRASRHVCRET